MVVHKLPRCLSRCRGSSLSSPPPPPSATESTCSAGPQFQHLQLNAPAQKLWGCWTPGAESVRAVFLTFGSHSMADFLLNWVEHVKRLDQRLYLVGALDAKLAALCLEHGIPAATISDETLSSMGVDRLGEKAATTYYRYAPGTFLRMGLIKQVIIREMLTAGLDAMVSDVDVAWLRSPWPLIRYSGASQKPVQGRCRLLALADVVLSVDQVQQYMDTDRYYWHIGSDLNTGVAFFRNSPGALAVLDEWKRAMAKAIAKRNPNHDQFWLNEVLQRRDFINLKSDAAAQARAGCPGSSTASGAPTRLAAGYRPALSTSTPPTPACARSISSNGASACRRIRWTRSSGSRRRGGNCPCGGRPVRRRSSLPPSAPSPSPRSPTDTPFCAEAA